MTWLPTLTLQQPYASLVMAGTKTIETRSWAAPKGLVGRRIGIHAGKAWDPVWGGWLDTVIDDDMLWHLEDLGVLLTDSSDDTVSYRAWRPSLPAGALLGTAVLAGCVPIGRCYDNDSVQHVCFAGGGLLHHTPLHEPWPDGQTEYDVTDQAPFGFFEPGNWAWLLEDVKPTTERCPWCQGSLNDPARQDEAWFHYGTPEPASIPPCPVCPGEDGYPVGKCGPIPANGQQRIWRWTP